MKHVAENNPNSLFLFISLTGARFAKIDHNELRDWNIPGLMEHIAKEDFNQENIQNIKVIYLYKMLLIKFIIVE